MGGGFLRYGVWGVHIWVKEGPKGVFDLAKPKLMLLSCFFLDPLLKFDKKLLFSNF